MGIKVCDLVMEYKKSVKVLNHVNLTIEHFVLHQCKRKGDYCMSTVTSQNQTAPVVRQYEIGGVRYIVKATVKDGAKETAVKKIRRLLQNDLSKAAT